MFFPLVNILISLSLAVIALSITYRFSLFDCLQQIDMCLYFNLPELQLPMVYLLSLEAEKLDLDW